MKVIKLIELHPLQDDEGKWNTFCQVYIGNSYVYGAVITETLEEAMGIKEGTNINIEKMKFIRRTSI